MAEISIEDFRAEVVAFLDANAARKSTDVKKPFVWGEGSDDVSLFEEIDREREAVALAAAKGWRAKRFDAGLGWITGPVEYGGRALPHAYERLYQQLEREYDIPNQGFFTIGLGMVAPTIAAHARPEIAARYLPGMFRADIVGAQLFSEPGAGSDLASLQCRAERDGDEWVITGQKVWTSGAHYCDIGEVVCRTDPDAPKHKGITAFLVDMHDPNIEIRPLRQMTGGASFNEVFFNEYRVRDDHRLGEVHEGWAVAITTLMNERASIGAGGGGGNLGATKLIEMARHFGVADDPVTRQELMAVYIGSQVSRYTNQRAMDNLKSGRPPGPELSMSKLALTNNMRRTVAFVSRVLGPRMVADTGEWGTYSYSGFVLGVPAMSIAGGSDEVLKNIIGERVLGLPKDPGIDVTTPFRELRVGTQTS